VVGDAPGAVRPILRPRDERVKSSGLRTARPGAGRRVLGSASLRSEAETDGAAVDLIT